MSRITAVSMKRNWAVMLAKLAAKVGSMYVEYKGKEARLYSSVFRVSPSFIRHILSDR